MWVPDGRGGDGGAAPAGAAVPVLRPEDLAQDARAAAQVPYPEVGLAPDGDPLRVLVNMPTFFWIENREPVTARAEVAGVWAEATATPARAIFAGDEEAACAGLGVPWVAGMGRRNIPGDACTYTYQQVHARATAAVTVVWEVSWVGSDGTGGVLEPFLMTTEFDLSVLQRQAIGVEQN